MPFVKGGRRDSSASAVLGSGVAAAFADEFAYLLLSSPDVLCLVNADAAGVEASFEVISFAYKAGADSKFTVDAASKFHAL